MISTTRTTTASFLVKLLFLGLTSVAVAQQEDGCADVVGGSATLQADGTWIIAATVGSSYETGWDKYANEWKVETLPLAIAGNGTLLGTRTLGHPHVNEQPFTRSLSGVVIPMDVSVVVLSAQDSVSGYCGESFELQLPGRLKRQRHLQQEDGCADVVDGTARQLSDGSWTIAATVASSYETGWDKYANEWKIETLPEAGLGGVGQQLGTRVLGHPHVNEQPFTRSLSGIAIPDDVSVVVLSAQDLLSGYCGESFELKLPGRTTPVVEDTTGTLEEANTNNEMRDAQDSPETVIETVEAPSSSGLVRKTWCVGTLGVTVVAAFALGL